MKVVVLLIDTLRHDFLGFNNPGIKTPNIDELANKSIVFDKAYLGSYPCMPARRDLYTGRFEFPFRGWGPLEYDDEDLPKLITQQRGLTSMLITDHYHLWEQGSGNYHFKFSGYEFIRGQEYDKWRIEPNPTHRPDNEKWAQHLPEGDFEQNLRNVRFRDTEKDYFPAMVMSRAADWVEKNRHLEDFFMMIDCFDPHEPFDPPQHYVDLYDPSYEGEEITWPTYGWNTLTDEETRHVRALYAGELTMTDRWVGYFLDKLEQLRLMDDTMIILTTDHGHMFGEHGIMGKPWSGLSDSNMYEEVSHIPLLIYHPQAARPERIDELVQLVDLYPTILEAFGIRPPEGTQGNSLMPYVSGNLREHQAREVACFGRFGEAINITDGEWTLFIWPPGAENTPLNWYSQSPPEFGPYKVMGPKEPHQAHDRWPVACARGQMTTQLFNIREDPEQLRDLAEKRPEIVGRLKRQATKFLKSVRAPSGQIERLGL